MISAFNMNLFSAVSPHCHYFIYWTSIAAEFKTCSISMEVPSQPPLLKLIEAYLLHHREKHLPQSGIDLL